MIAGLNDTDKIRVIVSHTSEKMLNHIDPTSFAFNDGSQYLSDRAIKFIRKMGGIMEVHKLIEKRGI
jgi:hypothetical protein